MGPRLGLLTLVFAACAGPAHEIVEDRFDLAETSSSPEVTEISDVGGGDVALTGNLSMQAPDGVAVIGETLWIRGRSFGRQPAVLVGGRPAAVLGRTRDGGIVVRVPAATPSGAQPVVVNNEVGRGERSIAVRRYAAVLAPGGGELGWAELGPDGPIAAGKTAVGGARWLALSSDGRAAYLADVKRSVVSVVEIPAPGGPKVIYHLDLGPAAIVALAAAERAPVLAVVRERDVLLLDTTSPLRPARSTPRALPAEIQRAHVVAADLSPDGKLLAIATADGNRVALLDLVPEGRAPVTGALSVMPDVRESVLVDLAFSPAADTLWVLSGDNPRSRASGPQPTELRAIRLSASPETMTNLEVARVVAVGAARDPARIAVGRAPPLVSGAAIRLPPERATVFFAAATKPAVPAPEIAPGAHAAITPDEAAVFRVGVDDAASVSITAVGHLGMPDLSFDGRWLLAPVAASDGSIRVLSAAVDGRPAPSPAPLEIVRAGAGELPPAARPLPQLRIQP
ncbi:MAG TPA: IPT/TIG domain-containing protein [Polyangia bacterium]|nr:IPT/TIG domain-containing protein [Polyangia bacterium]